MPVLLQVIPSDISACENQYKLNPLNLAHPQAPNVEKLGGPGDEATSY